MKSSDYRFFKFIFIGIINTLNYYCIYLLLLKICALPYLFSHIIAFLLSFIASYFLNCYFVFHVTPQIKSFLQFPLTQVINMGLQTAILYIAVDLLHMNATISPFFALVFTVPITYMISTKIFTKEKR